jgi:hypothetical protein
MWDNHCRAELAVRAARVATTKAKNLLAQANISNGNTRRADDPSDGYLSTASSTILHTGMNTPTAEGSQHDSASIAASSGSDEEQSEDSPTSATNGTPQRVESDIPIHIQALA